MAERRHLARRLGQLLTVLGATGFALGLLWLSVPRLFAGLAMLPGNEIKSTYLSPILAGESDQPSTAQLETWRESRLAALQWIQIPDAWADLSLIAMLEARQADRRSAARPHYEAARSAVQHALALSPSDSFMWLRLASLESVLDSPSETILAAVRNSIQTARYEPAALYGRVYLGFRHWQEADAEFQESLLDQVALMAPAGRWAEIERLARHFPGQVPHLRDRLDGSERALTAIARALEDGGG